MSYDKHLRESGLELELADFDRALKYYRSATSLVSGQAREYVAQGVIHDLKNDFLIAADYFEHAIPLCPNVPELHKLQAAVQRKQQAPDRK